MTTQPEAAGSATLNPAFQTPPPVVSANPTPQQASVPYTQPTPAGRNISNPSGAWNLFKNNLGAALSRGSQALAGAFRTTHPQTNNGNKSVLGMPWWAAVLAAILVILMVRSIGVEAIKWDFTPSSPDLTQYDHILEVGGVKLPINIAAIPHPPFQNASPRQWLPGVFALLMVVVVFKDNITARPNQQPAYRSTVGFCLFFLANFLIGWIGTLLAVMGLILARRPRKGGQMVVWPYILAVGFGLYLWFDAVSPWAINTAIPWLNTNIPWLSRVIEWLFTADNIRPLALVAFVLISIESMFKREIDDTTLCAIGLVVIGWYSAFGVWLYAENLVVGSWLYAALLWIIAGVSFINALQEQTQNGTIGVAAAAVFLLVIGWLAALGVRFLLMEYTKFSVEPGSFAYKMTTPAGSSIMLLFLLSLTLNIGVKSSGLFLELANALMQWTGSAVDFKPLPLSVPVDFYLTIALIWCAVLLGTNWPVI